MSSSSQAETPRRTRILSSKLYFDVPPSKVPIIYSSSYNISFLGFEKLHPFDSSKWGRICQFLVYAGVLDNKCIVEPEEASKEDLLVVHPEKYLDSLKSSSTVASIVEVPPLAMLPNWIVQYKVLHPFRKQDFAARRYIDQKVEMKSGTSTDEYLKMLDDALEVAGHAFNPDLLVYNAGTDILDGDPLGRLRISPDGIIKRDEKVFAFARDKSIPLLMLTSGGYMKSSARVIADSIMNLSRKQLIDMTTKELS